MMMTERETNKAKQKYYINNCILLDYKSSRVAMLHVFSFLFGGFSVIICGFYLLVRFLEALDTKTEKEYKDILADAAKERAERRYDTSRFNTEKRGKIFIKTPENTSAESPEWSHCVLKNNMLFLFRQATDTSAIGVICFDNCSISIIRNKTSKFHKKNGIVIIHPERELLFHSKILHFFFENGKELETWYWFLKEASSLTIKKTPDEEAAAKLCQQFFTDLPVRACVPGSAQQTVGNMSGYFPSNSSVAANSSNSSSSSSSHKRNNSNSNSKEIEMSEILMNGSSNTSTGGSPTTSSSSFTLRERKSAGFTSSPVSTNTNTINSTSTTPPYTSTTTTTNTTTGNLQSTPLNIPTPLQTAYTNTIDGISGPVAASKFDWLNVLLGRVFFNIYNADELLQFASSKIIKKINKLKKPSILKSITLQNLDFGTNLPILQDAKLLFITPQGELSCDLLLKYHGGFTLTIKIEVMISFRGHSVTIPFVISVTVKSLSGRMNIQCLPPPTKRIWVGFYGEPECELDIDTSIGQSKTSYLNLPKVAKIIVNKLKAELFEMMVLPNTDDWPLPHAKQKKNKDPLASVPTPLQQQTDINNNNNSNIKS
ncbi:PH domain-containing protein [Cavenderia fasciculata]|uniref:PH domain-containing protein n=1 Tax=Cavenderia fasciculata TaxID=261658 RepID=F4Q9S7_CACFS|nr:PH domain-containing protein [Cavenderia fasciculata]EGG15446.1 PH domain-containing protein [Cavenderia fasciculata]|eukprot:XP_004354188.1 PH domain-containing protein [Cavenderia fasciculata]